MVFKDRAHAGKLLSQTLMAARIGSRPGPEMETLVLALPRGGVPVAIDIATALHAPLDVLVSKKIGAPDQPEFAIGAVSSRGVVITNPSLNQAYVSRLQHYLESERNRLLDATLLMEQYWRSAAGIEQQSCRGKRVIVIDDGIATGMTTLAALRSIRESGASFIVLATPVISRDTLRWLSGECDLSVAVTVPEDLTAIGLFYEDFQQVEDEEVVRGLQACASAGKEHPR